VLLDFKNEKILFQEKLYINAGDLKKINYDQIYLSPCSDIEQPKQGEFEQNYNVCIPIDDY
jgi:hypothetical protein